jgi:hypothetical protein
MIEDFIQPHGQGGYDEQDLKAGIEFAEWQLEEGYTTEYMYGYDLKKFVKWAKKKLLEYGGKTNGEKVKA